jgi:hypothetical protein
LRLEIIADARQFKSWVETRRKDGRSHMLMDSRPEDRFIESKCRQASRERRPTENEDRDERSEQTDPIPIPSCTRCGTIGSIAWRDRFNEKTDTTMFQWNATADDDPRFIKLVSRLIAGAVAVHQVPDVRVYKIDNWFDHWWLRFSGKTLGAVGVRAKALTIPPFVANRIVGQWRYRRDEIGDGYQLIDNGRDIHHQGWSAANLQRRLRHIVPSSALFWFSGNTVANGRGSLMAYLPIEQDHWPWFLAFARNGEWKIMRRKDIHENETRLFEKAADKIQLGAPGLGPSHAPHS